MIKLLLLRVFVCSWVIPINTLLVFPFLGVTHGNWKIEYILTKKSNREMWNNKEE